MRTRVMVLSKRTEKEQPTGAASSAQALPPPHPPPSPPPPSPHTPPPSKPVAPSPPPSHPADSSSPRSSASATSAAKTPNEPPTAPTPVSPPAAPPRPPPVSPPPSPPLISPPPTPRGAGGGSSRVLLYKGATSAASQASRIPRGRPAAPPMRKMPRAAVRKEGAWLVSAQRSVSTDSKKTEWDAPSRLDSAPPPKQDRPKWNPL
eukprot:scaffold25667_cov68-Isochrysis_galbana.AAC.1